MENINRITVRTAYFTANGEQTAKGLFDRWQQAKPIYRTKEQKLADFAREAFENHQPLLFVGACGIAVRTIAPFIKDKLADSPVLVMDEKGEFIIPILSGHVGGANDLASKIEALIGAKAVITTATDVQHSFAVDVFAKKNGLEIKNREGIQRVSSRILSEGKIKIACMTPNAVFEGRLPDGVEFIPGDLAIDLTKDNEGDDHSTPDVVIIDDEQDLSHMGGTASSKASTCFDEDQGLEDHALVLYPKRLVLGMGCKRGKEIASLRDFVFSFYEEQYLRDNLYAIASVDAKKDEPGLNELAQFLGVPFVTYSADKLDQLEGSYTESAFVRETIGTGNVCERAAAILGDGGIVMRKQAFDGMTLAAAKRDKIIIRWDR